MALGRPEKICAHDKDKHGTWRWFSKWSAQKKLRILARLDPEGAPTKVGHFGMSN